MCLFQCSALIGAEARWWKGNTHTHSLWSDGDDYPEMIVDWYKRNGYQFLALSDHNIVQAGERWLELKPPTVVAGEIELKGGGVVLENYVLYKTEQPELSTKEREKYIGSFSLD